jgi:hypothetical protein
MRDFGITRLIKNDRKMCVVVPHPLGKGSRCAPPLHPPGSGPVRALSPAMSSKTYRRFIPRWTWRHPSPPAPNHGPALRRWTGSRAFAPPEPHSQGDFCSPCTHRLGRRSCPQDPRPFHGDQPSAVWMRAILSQLDHVQCGYPNLIPISRSFR